MSNDIRPSNDFFDQRVVTVHDLLGRHTLLADGDGHAVFIRSADRDHVAAFEPQITGIDVRRYVTPRQVADMYRTIRIGSADVTR